MSKFRVIKKEMKTSEIRRQLKGYYSSQIANKNS